MAGVGSVDEALPLDRAGRGDQALTDIDAATLARLSPIFFERRKVDRRGYDPAAIVSFRFRSDQVFEGAPDTLQAQLATQLGELRAMAMAPKTLAELSADELVLRAFGQPDESVATAAREEMIARLHRAEMTGGVPTATMMEQLTEMMWLVSNLYYLVKPPCRVCALPATHVLQVSEHQRDYRCDSHPIPPPQANAARDLQGAAMIRAAAFVARQSIPVGQGPRGRDARAAAMSGDARILELTAPLSRRRRSSAGQPDARPAGAAPQGAAGAVPLQHVPGRHRAGEVRLRPRWRREVVDLMRAFCAGFVPRSSGGAPSPHTARLSRAQAQQARRT